MKFIGFYKVFIENYRFYATAIATIMAIREGIIPPTINYENPDEECDLNYTPNKAVKRDIKYGLSNSLGFGGHNASVLFKKYVE